MTPSSAPHVLSGSVLAAAIAGALEIEQTPDGVRPWRLPANRRRHAPAALTLMAEFTAGVRVRLVTSASALRVEASVARLVGAGQEAPASPAPFVAVVEGAVADRVDLDRTGLVREELRSDSPDRVFERGIAVRSTVELALGSAPGERLVEVWLPQDAAVLLHAIEADAPLRPADADPRARWLHHGSSISHGGSADGPLGTWPARAAALLGVNGTNLGFGGNAMLDPDVARAIGATEADVITLKLGINLVGADAMRRRTFLPALHGFLDLIREARPDTPIAVITAIGCPNVEETPGPIRAGSDGRATGTPRETRIADGTLTLRATREAVAEVVAARSDDPALHLVDGLELLSAAEGHLLPDNLHPGQEGYDLMADRFAALARDPATPLGAAFARVLPAAS